MLTSAATLTRWIGMLAVSALLGACTVAVSQTPITRPLTPVPRPIRASLPSPRTTTVGGVRYTVGATPAQGALTGTDPRQVTVLVFDGTSPTAPACNTVAPGARLVRETATAVVIATFSYRYRATAPRAGAYCYYTFAGGSSPYARFVVRLHAPLGRRRLLDAASGEQIGILNPGRVPEPTHLPAGYRLVETRGFGDDAVESIRQYRHQSQYLELRRSSLSTWTDPHGTIVGVIHGSPIIAMADGSERCVDWSDTPGIIDQACSHGHDPKRRLSFAVLATIAASVH